MLMCTAKDMAVLCDGNAEVCYSKYGSIRLRAKYCQEMALKILLASIEERLDNCVICFLKVKDVSVELKAVVKNLLNSHWLPVVCADYLLLMGSSSAPCCLHH